MIPGCEVILCAYLMAAISSNGELPSLGLVQPILCNKIITRTWQKKAQEKLFKAFSIKLKYFAFTMPDFKVSFLVPENWIVTIDDTKRSLLFSRMVKGYKDRLEPIEIMSLVTYSLQDKKEIFELSQKADWTLPDQTLSLNPGTNTYPDDSIIYYATNSSKKNSLQVHLNLHTQSAIIDPTYLFGEFIIGCSLHIAF